MKKIALLIFYILCLNAQNPNSSQDIKITKEIERLDAIPNILDLKREESFFYFKEKEAFGTIREFITTNFKINKNSPKYRIFLYYKELLKNRLDDSNRSLLEEINLNRLNFVYRYFIGEDKDRYYTEALNRVAKRNKEAYRYLTKIYFKNGEYKKALESAKKSPLDDEIEEIVNTIESKYLAISMDKVALPKENLLARVDFKNVKKIYIKIFKNSDINNSIIENKIEYLNSLKPFREIELNLPDTQPYTNESTEISLGEYDIGEYTLLLSYNNKYIPKDTAIGTFRVSNIAILKQNKHLLIVDRKSGKPIVGAKIIFYEDINREKILTSIFSNKNGLVEIPKSLKKYFIDVEYKNRIFKIKDLISKNQIKIALKPKTKVYILKDKKSYFPNETIKFQGIIVKSFPDKEPKAISNKKIELTLYNRNNKKLKSQILKSDNFGTFSGKFKIPNDITTDTLTLKSNYNSIDKIKILHDKKSNIDILLNKIDISKNSKIEGVVESKSNLDFKLKSIRFYLLKNRVLVDAGSGRVFSKNRFSIELNTPSNSHYMVYIIATSLKGEKSLIAKDLNRKRANLRVKLIIDNLLNKNSSKTLFIKAKNLQGDDVNISGKIVVEKIIPTKLFRYRYWQDITKPIYNEIEFGRKFVNFFKKENRKVVQKISFNTKKRDKIDLKIEESGIYEIKLLTKDKKGIDAKFSKKIVVFDIDSNKPPFKTYIWDILDKKSYQVGSTAILTIKSSKPDVFMIFELEKNGKILKEEFLRVDKKTTIQIPILKEYRGGLNYSITTVAENRVYIKRGKIDVPWDNKLKVSYIRFNKILKPENMEEWKFKIETEDKKDIKTQMLGIISNKKPTLKVDKIYPKNRQNYSNLWRPFDFDLNKIEIYDKKENKISKNSLQSNIIFKLKYKNNKIVSQKTLLFKPQIESKDNGEIDFNFKTPKELGKWKFFALIYSKNLKFTTIDEEIEIKKDLLIESKVPNFFRVGDKIFISTKITNRSDRDLNITATLNLIDTITKKDILNGKLSKKLFLKKGESIIVDFKMDIPNVNSKEVEYRFIAWSKEYKEEFKKRISLIRDYILDSKSILEQLKPKESKNIIFTPLKDINLSNSSYKKLIFEFSSNLSWEAIMSAKELIKQDAHSNIEIFDRYFVSSILLDLSKAYKNIDRRIDIFNSKELLDIQDNSLNKLLKENISKNGGWGWFKDRDSNFYVTLYILDGFRKLKEIGIKPKIDKKILNRALTYIDSVVISKYRDIKDLNRDNLTQNIIYYLYIRSFYNKSLLSKEIYNYYIDSIKKYWHNKSLYQQSLIALILNKKLGKNISIEILENIERFLLVDKNLGLYFNIKNRQILTHTTVMELLYKLEENHKSAELMKIWLIEQKNANGWTNSTITANSIYAILSHSKWILDNIKPIEISFNTDREYIEEIKKANETIKNGVGYYRLEFNNFNKRFANINLKNNNNKPIWTHIYLEYLNRDLNISSSIIKIKKEFNKSRFRVGDIVDVNIKLKLKMDREFLILKDELPIPFKIIDSSKYLKKDNIKYYKLVTKSSILLYFPKLSKGEYNFKYRVLVTHTGKFRGGVTTIRDIFNTKILGYFKSNSIKVFK